MEGAIAVASGEIGSALLVGFDYVVAAGFARLLAEQSPTGETDPVDMFISAHHEHADAPVGRLLAATWRAALDASADGIETARGAFAIIIAYSSVGSVS
jgi:hypothetical protein